MKRLLLLSTLLCSPAFAADLPQKAPLPAPSPVAYDPFSGWFLGAEVGYDWGKANTDISGVPTFKPNGILGGGSLGYRSAMGSGWYLGLDTSLDAVGGNDTIIFNKNLSAKAQNSWLGATMVQIGYRFGDLLFYGEGGVAYGANKASITFGKNTLSDTERGAGWAAGAGIDYSLRQWNIPGLLTAEYRHYDLGKSNFGANIAGPITIGTRIKDTADAVLVGYKYKFGS